MSQQSDFYLGRSQLTAAASALTQARTEIRLAAASKWESPAARTYRNWYLAAERRVLGAENELASAIRLCAVTTQCTYNVAR